MSPLFAKPGRALYEVRDREPHVAVKVAIEDLLQLGYTITVPSPFVLNITPPWSVLHDSKVEFRVSYFQHPFDGESDLLVVFEHKYDDSIECEQMETKLISLLIVEQPDSDLDEWGGPLEDDWDHRNLYRKPFVPPRVVETAYESLQQFIASWAAGRERARGGEEPRRGGDWLRLWEGLPRGAFAEVLLQLGSPCEVSLE
jgi:hypothetical protein